MALPNSVTTGSAAASYNRKGLFQQSTQAQQLAQPPAYSTRPPLPNISVEHEQPCQQLPYNLETVHVQSQPQAPSPGLPSLLLVLLSLKLTSNPAVTSWPSVSLRSQYQSSPELLIITQGGIRFIAILGLTDNHASGSTGRQRPLNNEGQQPLDLQVVGRWKGV